MAGKGNLHPVDRLIQDIAETGRLATQDELKQVSEYVAGIGFTATELPRHHEKHVTRQREWPQTMSETEYAESLRQMVLDHRSGVAISQWWRTSQWHVTMMGRSAPFKGPGGHDWIAVEYRVGDGSWATAFQPVAGLEHVNSHHRRRNVRWLRQPT